MKFKIVDAASMGLPGILQGQLVDALKLGGGSYRLEAARYSYLRISARHIEKGYAEIVVDEPVVDWAAVAAAYAQVWSNPGAIPPAPAPASPGAAQDDDDDALIYCNAAHRVLNRRIKEITPVTVSFDPASKGGEKTVAIMRGRLNGFRYIESSPPPQIHHEIILDLDQPWSQKIGVGISDKDGSTTIYVPAGVRVIRQGEPDYDRYRKD